MGRKSLIYAIFIALAAVFFILINTIRPINETAAVSQLVGTDIATPYLGRTTNVADGGILTQTFRSPRDGRLNGFGILLPGLNRRSKGLIKVELIRETRAGPERVLFAKTRVERLSNNEGPSVWRAKPLDVARGDKFTIKVKVEAEGGLTVFVAPGNTYKGGTAGLDDREIDADIGFQVYYGLSLAEFAHLLATDWPNLLGPNILLIVLLVLIVAVGFWFHGLYTAFFPEQESATPDESAAEGG